MSKDIHKLRAHIFIDANVLIGAFRGLKSDVLALEYLNKLPQIKLFTSSLAIAQTIATCQKKNNSDNRTKLVEEISGILKRFSIISCTAKDIEKAITMEQPDIEDNLQFVMGERMDCTYYITNNKKDFVFTNVTIIPSSKIRLLGA